MIYYRTCPSCGAHLDPGEKCDCFESKYARLTPENKRKVDEEIDRMVEKQKAAHSATNTEGGGAEHVDHAVSASIIAQR